MNDVQYTFFKNIIFNIQNSIELIELDHKSFFEQSNPYYALFIIVFFF